MYLMNFNVCVEKKKKLLKLCSYSLQNPYKGLAIENNQFYSNISLTKYKILNNVHAYSQGTYRWMSNI